MLESYNRKVASKKLCISCPQSLLKTQEVFSVTSKYLQTFTDPFSHKSHMEYFTFIQVHSLCGTAHCSFTIYIELLKLTHHSTKNDTSLTSLLFSTIGTAYRSDVCVNTWREATKRAKSGSPHDRTRGNGHTLKDKMLYTHLKTSFS